jgi:hypothetical protein
MVVQFRLTQVIFNKSVRKLCGLWRNGRRQLGIPCA